MAKRKENKKNKINDSLGTNIVGLHSEVIEQPITDTLESNYMPYAMSVIVSRAIPEIDGFKPSHRKLLYTMYKMGLLNGNRQKSANIVGRTMQLNPHGDAAIYETMVRLAAGHEALLNPFIDSKGNFGKVYSRDMSYAASRYTEARLMPICSEIFKDIDKDTVDFTDSYDGTQKEPMLLPTAFPNVLVSANTGIAVGMASNICGFNLKEVCEATAGYISDPDFDILSVMPAPDFPTGGEIIYSRSEMESIYASGRGNVKIRSKWRYVKEDNIIEIFEIPYTTTTEIIIDRIADLTKSGKIREINDMRDETDLKGLKLAIDLKRGTDPDKLMSKLFKLTPLQDSYSCNFNILVAGNPKVMGVREILSEWISWREESIRRSVFFDLSKKREKLHLLSGLEFILLDIDKAIEIIRNTELESDVVPNLMVGFGIDEVQAEYVAEIKLRNINREFILKRISEKSELESSIRELEETLNSRRKIKRIILDDLDRVKKKYGIPRKSSIVYDNEIVQYDDSNDVPDYPVNIFLSKEGYFKKITPQSLKMSGEQKYKEGDTLQSSFESNNNGEIIVFTNRQQAYKARLSDFEDMKASGLGVFLPSKLSMDDGEGVVSVIAAGDYSGYVLFVFENGKVAKVDLASYETKTNRKKLINAYSDSSALIKILFLDSDKDIVLYTTDGKAVVVNTCLMQSKSSKSTLGVNVVSARKGRKVYRAEFLDDSSISDVQRYRAKNIPSAGAAIRSEDTEEKQISLLPEE